MTKEEGEELSTTTCALAVFEDPLIPLDKLSSFSLYKRVIAWVVRFIHNCRARVRATERKTGPLTVEELNRSANYWYTFIQGTHFPGELRNLSKGSQKVSSSSKLYSLNPFTDDQGVRRIGGRQHKLSSPTPVDTQSFLIRSTLSLNCSSDLSTHVSFMEGRCLYPRLYSETSTYSVDTGPSDPLYEIVLPVDDERLRQSLRCWDSCLPNALHQTRCLNMLVLISQVRCT